MSTNPAIELASTIQSASINRAPSPTHDINPSTAASQKIPVSASEPSLSQYLYDTSDAGDLEEVLEDGIEVDDEDGIPEEVLRPLPRRKSFGPLPDLRFEQSYLRSIEGCESNYGVAAVTIRDQVLLPLMQGTIWSLLLFGWRHWNRATQLSGQTVGARVRRWWYETNNWTLPGTAKGFKGKMGSEKLAREMGDFYQNRSEFD